MIMIDNFVTDLLKILRFGKGNENKLINVFGIARHLLFTLPVSLFYQLVSFDLG